MDHERSIDLMLPANMEYALVARMAMSGFGMLAGLEVDLIDDLRTVTDECLDCLIHQSRKLKQIHIRAWVDHERLYCRICTIPTEFLVEQPAQDYEVTRCILETLLPDVCLNCDETGVSCIEFSMPV